MKIILFLNILSAKFRIWAQGTKSMQTWMDFVSCRLIKTSPTGYEPPRDITNKMTVRPAKTQISLGIRTVWSESSLGAQVILLVLSWVGSYGHICNNLKMPMMFKTLFIIIVLFFIYFFFFIFLFFIYFFFRNAFVFKTASTSSFQWK